MPCRVLTARSSLYSAVQSQNAPRPRSRRSTSVPYVTSMAATAAAIAARFGSSGVRTGVAPRPRGSRIPSSCKRARAAASGTSWDSSAGHAPAALAAAPAASSTASQRRGLTDLTRAPAACG